MRSFSPSPDIGLPPRAGSLSCSHQGKRERHRLCEEECHRSRTLRAGALELTWYDGSARSPMPAYTHNWRSASGRFGRDEHRGSNRSRIDHRSRVAGPRARAQRLRRGVDGNAYSVPWRLIGEQVEVWSPAIRSRRHGFTSGGTYACRRSPPPVIDPTHLLVLPARTAGRGVRRGVAEEPGPLPASICYGHLLSRRMIGGSF